MLEERWLTKYSRPAKIRFFGVWDTVGSMGIPRSSAEPKVHNYRFLDTHLRLDNEYADALALDEHREDFEATFWTVKTGEAGAPDHPSSMSSSAGTSATTRTSAADARAKSRPIVMRCEIFLADGIR